MRFSGSSKPRRLCKYSVSVDPEVLLLEPSITQRNFAAKVESTLNDPRGWVKYGFVFEYIGEAESGDKNDLHIILVSGPKAKIRCGSRLGGFSCYSPDENYIYMNLDNWMGKSKSELPLERYRTYVVNHEVGHRLGFGHPESQKEKYCNANPGKRGSVMIQMTRGPDWVAPCIENEWPLDPGEYDETKNPHLDNTYPVEGSSERFASPTNALAAAVVGGGVLALNSPIAVAIVIVAVMIFIWFVGRRDAFTEIKSVFSNAQSYLPRTEQLFPYQIVEIMESSGVRHAPTGDNGA